jgi:hypothetical protein
MFIETRDTKLLVHLDDSFANFFTQLVKRKVIRLLGPSIETREAVKPFSHVEKSIEPEDLANSEDLSSSITQKVSTCLGDMTVLSFTRAMTTFASSSLVQFFGDVSFQSQKTETRIRGAIF